MSHNVLDVIPPHDEDVERAVLSACLFDADALNVAVDSLSDDQFYRPEYQTVFRGMKDLWKSGKPVDQFTLTDKLKLNGDLEHIGGEGIIVGLAADPVSGANVRHHAGIVRDKAQARAILRLAAEIREQVDVGQVDGATLQARVSRQLDEIARENTVTEFVSAQDGALEAYKKIIERIEAADGVIGLTTGLPHLDRYTGGLQPGDIIVVGAYSSEGKTTFAQNVASSAAVKGHPIGIMSMEMSAERLFRRFIAAKARYPVSAPLAPSKRDFQVLNEASEWVYQLPIYVDATPGLTKTELAARAKRMKREFDIEMLIVDYLQLMSSEGRADSRQQSIEAASHRLKSLAIELDIPIIVISQLSRADKTNRRPRPTMHDLRDSGAIENDADVILFLYDSPQDDKVELAKSYGLMNSGYSMDNIRELIIEKNRDGAKATMPVYFRPEYYLFGEPTPRKG